MDLRRDGNGQFFELRVPTHLSESLEISVMQALPEERHLLLAVRNTEGKPQLDRFLCGHDEREWFVAAVPGGASSVRQAMDALQPEDVREALARNHVSSRKRYSRKNRAFRRQGEWFFVPELQTRNSSCATNHSVVVLASRTWWKNSTAPAVKPFMSAEGIRTASRRRNTAQYCSAILRPPAGAGR